MTDLWQRGFWAKGGALAFGIKFPPQVYTEPGFSPSTISRALLIALLVFVSTCRPPAGQTDLFELDRRVLSAVERFLAPVPRFSGSVFGRDFAPEPGGACPLALARVELPAKLDDNQRRELSSLGRAVGRLARSGHDEAAVFRVRALWALLEKPTPEGRDRVVNLFQAALANDPSSPERRNDLAAAHLLRATMDEQASDLASALELLEPGVAERDPADTILFNKAYALQCLTLWQEAHEIWQRLPGHSPALGTHRPPPARLAASDLTPPDSEEAPPDSFTLRRRGEWLLGEWATRSLRGDETAGDLLREADSIGALLQAQNGDDLLNAAVGVIRRTRQKGDHAGLLQLQRGHAAFHAVRGEAIYSECRPEALHSAESALAAAGSPFAGWVRVDQAVCAYFEKDFSRAEAILSDLRLARGSHSGSALRGRVEWLLGLLRMVQARFVDADRHYSAAIEIFSRLGEEAHIVYLRSLRAKSYEYGGARQEAWRERLAALSQRRAVRNPERLFTIFEEAAQALRSQGYPVAALGFLSEQMRAAEVAARQTGETDLLAYTLLARSALLAEIGRRTEAVSDLERTEAVWSRLSLTNESRRRLRIDLDVQLSFLDRGEPASPLAAVDRALAFFAGPSRSLGDQIEILKLYQIRAKMNVRRGSFAAARTDLRHGIAEVERQRLEVASMEDRARFLAQGRGLFLDLVRLELDQFHDPVAALEVLEWSSNRVLDDLTPLRQEQTIGGSPYSLREGLLREVLPPGTLVIRYGHLPDRLLLWTILDGRVDLEQRSISQAELIRQVRQCRDLLSRGTPSAGEESPCDTLARSILPRRLRNLPADSPVLLIPDEVTASLPFAALRTTPKAPYLLEKLRLSYTPGLLLWLRGGSASGQPPRRKPQAALFVSDPAFSSSLFPLLPRLTAARQAVAGYASHYTRTGILRDRQATVPALQKALEGMELLQFDGHGITNSQYPERGGLLMAPIDTEAPDLETSLLSAEDLPPQAFRKLRLVVLGACSTGLTTYSDTSEVTGLAAAFLARGVPEVIAAAWEVPDASSALLLDRFHRGLAAGKPADVALREAQLDLLHAGEPAQGSTWAAFQLFRTGNRKD